MKILFIAPQPFYSVRGTPIALLRMLHCLKNCGHQMDIATYPLGVDVNIPGVRLVRGWKIPFIKSVPIGASVRKVLLDISLFFTVLFRLIGRRYDVIHAIEEGAFLALPLAKVFRTPIVYDMDSYLTDQLAQHKLFHFAPFLAVTRWLERKTLQASAAVVTVCSDLTEKAVAAGCFPSKIFQIEDIPLNAEETPLTAAQREELRRKLQLNGEKLIVYSGNLEKYQGIELLLQSIAELLQSTKDFKLVVFGGEPEQVEAMKHYAASLGVARHVQFAGKRKIEEVNAYLELADILVSPRIQGTNVPLKIFTYMQSGRPVVATRLKMHTQVLEDKTAILADAEPRSFSQGMLKLLQNPALGREMASAARRVVEEKYSLKQFDQKIQALYAFLGGAKGESK